MLRWGFGRGDVGFLFDFVCVCLGSLVVIRLVLFVSSTTSCSIEREMQLQ